MAGALGGGPDHDAPAGAARADIQTRGERRLARQQTLRRHAHLAGRRLDGLRETVDANDVRMLSQKLADELVWRIHTAVAPVEVRKTMPSDVTITTGGRSKRSAAPAWRHLARRGPDARVDRPTVRHVRRQPANVVVVLWCGDLGAI